MNYKEWKLLNESLGSGAIGLGTPAKIGMVGGQLGDEEVDDEELEDEEGEEADMDFPPDDSDEMTDDLGANPLEGPAMGGEEMGDEMEMNPTDLATHIGKAAPIDGKKANTDFLGDIDPSMMGDEFETDSIDDPVNPDETEEDGFDFDLDGEGEEEEMDPIKKFMAANCCPKHMKKENKELKPGDVGFAPHGKIGASIGSGFTQKDIKSLPVLGESKKFPTFSDYLASKK